MDDRMRAQAAYRVDLVPYMDHIDVLRHDDDRVPSVMARVLSFMGDDPIVAMGVRAMVGTRARNWTDLEALKWAVRQQLRPPFELAHMLFELRVPMHLHQEFSQRGTWLWDDRAGTPYVGDPMYHPARGLWRVSLYDLLVVCDLWTDLRVDPVLRAIARHLIAVTRVWVPFTWDVWQGLVLDGVRLSNAEMAALRDVLIANMFRGRDPADVDQEQLVRAALERRHVYGAEQDAFMARLRVRQWRPR